MKSRALLVAALVAVLPHALYAQPGVQMSGDDDDEPSDGAEAKSMLPVRLDDLIEVAVRLSPDLARARVDRNAALHGALGSERAFAWTFLSNIQYERDAMADHTEAPPFSVVATDKLS